MCPKQGKAQAVRNPAVFFSPTNPRIHLFFSLIFLAIPYFGRFLFFVVFKFVIMDNLFGISLFFFVYIIGKSLYFLYRSLVQHGFPWYNNDS